MAMKTYLVVPTGLEPRDLVGISAYYSQSETLEAAAAAVAATEAKVFGTSSDTYDVYEFDGKKPVLVKAEVVPVIAAPKVVTLSEEREALVGKIAKNLVLLVKAHQDQPQMLEPAFTKILTEVLTSGKVQEAEAPKACGCGHEGCSHA